MILPGTYHNGFAPRDGEPLYPELWKDCIGAWNPGLGPSGLTLRDWSGFRNHGTLTNMDPGTDWVASEGRYGLDFDGLNDRVVTSLVLSSAFSVSLWFNKRTNGQFNERIIWGNSVNGNTYIADVTLSSIVVQSDTMNTSKTFNTQTISNNQWYHLAVTRNHANSVSVFLNGLKSSSGSQSINGSFTLNQLGFYIALAAFAWDGVLDDVFVCSHCKTENEIRLLATRRGIAYEMAPRRRASAAVAFNRRRQQYQQLVGGGVV